MFYLTMHSTHFIYGYMASDIWLRTILLVRKETRFRHIGYSYWLTARVLLYAPSHRQDNTYHGLCYTSRGALAGTRNNSPVKWLCIWRSAAAGIGHGERSRSRSWPGCWWAGWENTQTSGSPSLLKQVMLNVWLIVRFFGVAQWCTYSCLFQRFKKIVIIFNKVFDHIKRKFINFNLNIFIIYIFFDCLVKFVGFFT